MNEKKFEELIDQLSAEIRKTRNLCMDLFTFIYELGPDSMLDSYEFEELRDRMIDLEII